MFKRKLCLVFLIMDLTENIQRYYETYSVLMPIQTATTAVKAMREYCYGVFGFHSQLLNA
jgi:hypothetical protein